MSGIPSSPAVHLATVRDADHAAVLANAPIDHRRAAAETCEQRNHPSRTFASMQSLRELYPTYLKV